MSSAGAPRRDRGALEAAVLTALSAAGEARTPREVLSAVDADLAYTTVLTTLARLHDKALVTRHRVGRAYAYALSDGASRTARQMHHLLDAAASRAEVLGHFAAGLRADDADLLARRLSTAGQA